jgi:hypothetical protein
MELLETFEERGLAIEKVFLELFLWKIRTNLVEGFAP